MPKHTRTLIKRSSGCAVTRYSAEDSLTPNFVKQHPVRPDICPPDHIEWVMQYMPGDAIYLIKSYHQYEHQRCYDLYGGCVIYVVDKDIFSGPDIGCADASVDKETCIAKGGEWHNYNIIGLGKWCWWPVEE